MAFPCPPSILSTKESRYEPYSQSANPSDETAVQDQAGSVLPAEVMPKHLWVETAMPDLFQCSSCGYWRYPLEKSYQMKATAMQRGETIFSESAIDSCLWEEKKKRLIVSGYGYAYSDKEYVSISDGILRGEWISEHLPGCTY